MCVGCTEEERMMLRNAIKKQSVDVSASSSLLQLSAKSFWPVCDEIPLIIIKVLKCNIIIQFESLQAKPILSRFDSFVLHTNLYLKDDFTFFFFSSRL